MSQSSTEVAILGGGCFWCVEAVFSSLKGVTGVVSGFSGGKYDNPSYREVKFGRTGHAEVVKVTFDPTVLPYRELLRVFFTTHDPTTLHQQGADKGSQYRSVIFYRNESQYKTAKQVLEEMKVYFDEPIVTELTRYTIFFSAEAVHQNYYENNKDQPYCSVVITPKLQQLRKEHTSLLKGSSNSDIQ
ncbi:MAG: peptide-methionine (S)-S-oxide reductase MsrA [Bacteroidota bacterium]